MDAVFEIRKLFADYSFLLELGKQLREAKGKDGIEVFYQHAIDNYEKLAYPSALSIAKYFIPISQQNHSQLFITPRAYSNSQWESSCPANRKFRFPTLRRFHFLSPSFPFWTSWKHASIEEPGSQVGENCDQSITMEDVSVTPPLFDEERCAKITGFEKQSQIFDARKDYVVSMLEIEKKIPSPTTETRTQLENELKNLDEKIKFLGG
ncbi:hypothetical protein TNCT_347311 [Trichonephila clavata]|uniref:Uncharacterized protein n=1 Tax=Trichonephila clavata TaxID=2740835 RepID=A0A8X6JAC8_TRICU|nr:hypothetical protein TNCT_347311 [Trichonephila clavata]